jgi:DNA-directed RNA polymerase subunit alpha
LTKMHKPSVKVVNKNEFEGEFIIEPLERGFGHTLGNSIRRVLLSSIEGIGVTKIRIENADHEFSTVDGLREDIMELIANIKEVVFKMETSDKAILKLEKTGAGAVMASDIKAPAEVEIVNPECYLGTLSKAGR